MLSTANIPEEKLRNSKKVTFFQFTSSKIIIVLMGSGFKSLKMGNPDLRN
jgi:hypothetical protein